MLKTTPRRISYLAILGSVLGLLSGGAAWILIKLIALLTNLTLFGRVSYQLPSMTTLDPSPRILVVAVLGALAVSLIAKWSPIIKGHGIPETMESILQNQSRVAPRTAFAKPLSAAIAIGTGGPFGAEGPIIVTGGSIGSLMGQLLNVSPSERKILLACGAAGGMAATFGAPMASIVLAIELLLFEFSSRSFIPVAVSASVAGGVHSALFGSGPLFTVADHHFAGLAQLPVFALLGLASGFLAVLITRGLFTVEAGFRRLPVSDFWHPLIGALGFGLIGMAVPEVLGVGYDMIDMVLAGGMAVGALIILAGAKMVAWWLALGSGTSGGTLAPVLLISGSFGAFFGHIILAIWPETPISIGSFALVAMAATFGAATRATLTSIIFVFEITRDYNAILPLILASVVADLVGIWLLSETLMTEKLSRRGLKVSTDLRAHITPQTLVRDAMSSAVASIPVDATVDEAIDIITETGHSAFPLLADDGSISGIISRSDLLRADGHSSLIELASSDVVTVDATATVEQADRLMVTESVTHLPVTEDEKLIGMFTRTDLVTAYRPTSEQEDREAGWLGSRWARPTRADDQDEG